MADRLNDPSGKTAPHRIRRPLPVEPNRVEPWDLLRAKLVDPRAEPVEARTIGETSASSRGATTPNRPATGLGQRADPVEARTFGETTPTSLDATAPNRPATGLGQRAEPVEARTLGQTPPTSPGATTPNRPATGLGQRAEPVEARTIGETTPTSHAAPAPSISPSLGRPIIKVMGLGGGGSNAINRMVELGVAGVDFIAANTDKQALASSLAPTTIQLGPQITRGLGAGGDPKIGASAAMESSAEIAQALAGADMVFLTCGMGGGTGTGAAAVAAEIAREIGAVVIAVVTLPFGFEMSRRSQNAQTGVRALQPHTHTLITVPNDRLLKVVPKDVSLEIAFRLADDVLRQGIQGISELVTRPGLINVDFAHVRALMMRGGGALMSIGLGEGPDKARQAIQQALHHPLLEIDSLDQANGVLVDFTGGEDLSLHEIGEAVGELRESLGPETEIILGAGTDETLEGRAQVILIVTGLAGRAVAPVGKPTGEAQATIAGAPPEGEEDLDVPAFLRRRVSVSG